MCELTQNERKQRNKLQLKRNKKKARQKERRVVIMKEEKNEASIRRKQ
jgi:hypothetical protein